jgi:hypothetical protein
VTAKSVCSLSVIVTGAACAMLGLSNAVSIAMGRSFDSIFGSPFVTVLSGKVSTGNLCAVIIFLTVYTSAFYNPEMSLKVEGVKPSFYVAHGVV